ncbi:MAG: GNAT family N-acetyltransferase, partial [Defluviitaleaceae bacterium]|nr:GNAT family N-acetyltransferase [Defluviitaleaceae bacterium]
MHKIRQMKLQDYALLDKFLYNSIYIPGGEEMPPFDIIYDPEIYIYVKDFGSKDDLGAVAEVNGEVVAMAWTRIIPAYGNIDDRTPELAISTLSEWRGQGIGTDLMGFLFGLLRKAGYERTSLSVQQDNPAVRFYQRLG